jgi:tripartite-type tricarboxylate transporter receptor subunit TctC
MEAFIMPMHSLLRRACAGVVALFLVAGTAAAQSPPVRIVVGGPAGGNTDIAARLVSDRLAQILGTAVIIENKPGAGGTLAAEVVRNAKPDGLTIGLITASNAANETLIPNKSYRLLTDLEPLGLYAWLANVLIVNPDIKGATVDELVTTLKGRAGTNYSSGGIGSPGHLSGETFKLRTGVAMTHVPYKGAPPAVLAVVTGEVALMFATASAALPQIRAGKVRPLAVTSSERVAELPDVPTFAQAGLANFDVQDWVGFVLPKGTPAETRDRLDKAFAAAFADPAVRERLAKNTMLAAPQPLGPQAFGTFLARDVAKWADVIKAAGIKAE